MEAVDRFGHLVTAMVTPMAPDGSVDLHRAAALARFLIDQGSDSLVVAGTAGEAPALSAEERLALFRTVKEAVGDRAAVIGGTGTNDTKTSVALTRHAAALGLDGIMAVVPYYSQPSQEGIYRHFRAVAEASELPVMLSNAPARTGADLSVETVARLAELPNVVALKDASGNLEQVTEIVRQVPDLALYSGVDALTLPLLAIGAVGVVSVASHIAGPAIKQMIDAHLYGHRTRALELHLLLSDVCRSLSIASHPAAVKEALTLIGMGVGGVRLPLTPLTDPQRAEVARSVAALQGQLWSMPPRFGRAPGV